MATPVEIAVKAVGTAATSRALSGLDSKTSKLGSTLRNVARAGALALGAGAVVAARGLIDATQAAVDDEAAQSKLAQTLKNTTGATNKQVAGVEKWIEKQGKLLGVADDELRPALQRMAEGTKDVTKAQDMVSLAMDVSAGTGKSLKTVTEALLRAQNGSVGGLSRYGIATKNAKGETLSFDKVVKGMADTFGGQAAKHTETMAGKMARLKVTLDEAKEAIGAKLIPVVSRWPSGSSTSARRRPPWPIRSALCSRPPSTPSVAQRRRQRPSSGRTSGTCGRSGARSRRTCSRSCSARPPTSASTFGPILKTVGRILVGNLVPAFKAVGGFVAGTVVPIVAKLAQRVGTNLKPVFDAVAQTLRSRVLPAVQQGAAKFREWWPTIQKVITAVLKVSAAAIGFGTKILGKVLPPVIKFAGFLAGTLIKNVVGAIGIIIRIGGAVVDAGRKFIAGVSAVNRFVDGVAAKVGAALRIVSGIPGKITGALSGAGRLLLGIGGDIIGGLISGIISKASSLVSTIQNYVIDKIPGPLKKALGISSPSRVTQKIGRQIMDGLVKGIQGGAGVKTQLDRVSKLITTSINKRIEDNAHARRAVRARLKGLRNEYAAITKNGRAQDEANKKLEAARSTLRDLVSTSRDYAASIRDAVAATGDVTASGRMRPGPLPPAASSTSSATDWPRPSGSPL